MQAAAPNAFSTLLSLSVCIAMLAGCARIALTGF